VIPPISVTKNYFVFRGELCLNYFSKVENSTFENLE